jgi:hypothetical protein
LSIQDALPLPFATGSLLMSNDLRAELIRRFSVDYHALPDNLRIFVAQF